MYDKRKCIIMTISMIIGTILILIAKNISVLPYLYIISIIVSLYMIYFLPKKLRNKFNTIILKGMVNNMGLLFIIWFGPIATMFIIASTFKEKQPIGEI